MMRTYVLSDASRSLIIQLLNLDLGHAKDGLLRAQHQKKKDMSWKSGQGATVDEVIAGYEDWISRTELALEELR